jgi:hypothetical protein
MPASKRKIMAGNFTRQASHWQAIAVKKTAAMARGMCRLNKRASKRQRVWHFAEDAELSPTWCGRLSA